MKPEAVAGVGLGVVLGAVASAPTSAVLALGFALFVVGLVATLMRGYDR